MKKILTIFILICSVFLFNPFLSAFAQDKIDLKIKKNNSKYGLYAKSNGEEILTAKYNKIRKIKYDNNLIYIAEMPNYITLYSPSGFYDDFLPQYYKSNKYNSKVEFKNYPQTGVIRYKQNNKYGLIFAEKNKLHITKPLYEKIVFPDEDSAAARFLDISFAPEDTIIVYSKYNKNNYTFQNFKQILQNSSEYYNFKILLQSANIKENINLKDGILSIEFEDAQYFKNNFDITNRQKLQIPETVISQNEIFSIAETRTPYTFKNYPNESILKTGHKLLVFKDDKQYEILLPCSDFYIQESMFKNLTGIDIAFTDTENIIAKNGLWGIINKNNELITPFSYDIIYPIGSYIKEEINQNEIDYINSQTNRLFLVKRGYGWGIINNKNEIVIPLEYKRTPDNKEIAKLKNEINKKIQTDYNKEERANFKHELPYFILDLLLLPLWILMPYPFSGYVNIDY